MQLIPRSFSRAIKASHTVGAFVVLNLVFLSTQLSQNSCLAKDLKRFRKQLEREAGKPEARKCAFILETLKMPSEYHLFVEEFCKNPGITWVMKLVSVCSPKESER